jgi:hypothetical protein
VHQQAPVIMLVCFFVCIAIVEVDVSNNNVVASANIVVVVDVSFDVPFLFY